MIAPTKRDYRTEYEKRCDRGYQRWSLKRKPRCPACGFTYSDLFPKVARPVRVTAALLKRFAKKGFVAGQSKIVHRTAVGETVYLCSGCYEQLIEGRIRNTAPLPERIGPDYEREHREYAARRNSDRFGGGLKGYYGDVCVKCAARRREERKQQRQRVYATLSQEGHLERNH